MLFSTCECCDASGVGVSAGAAADIDPDANADPDPNTNADPLSSSMALSDPLEPDGSSLELLAIFDFQKAFTDSLKWKQQLNIHASSTRYSYSLTQNFLSLSRRNLKDSFGKYFCQGYSS